MLATTTKKNTQEGAEKRTGFTFEDYVVNTLNQMQSDYRRLESKIENDNRRLEDKIENRFMWMIGLTLGTFVTLVGLILSKH